MLTPSRHFEHRIVVSCLDAFGNYQADDYDYFCDGKDDDVQIIQAIEYVYNVFGGGTVQLDKGQYDVDMVKVKTALLRCPNVVIKGE